MSQKLSVTDQSYAVKYPFINPELNRIQNNQHLDTFYRKIAVLKQTGKGTVSIVHIGDSHLQAGFFSGVVRNSLQNAFGNAGRGLVFPYQLAESNSPDDISSSSNIKWKYNRIAHPEIALVPGISGFAIESSKPGASIHLSVKKTDWDDPSFTEVQLFADNLNRHLTLKPDEYDTTCLFESNKDSEFLYTKLNKPSTGFFLTNNSAEDPYSLYGVSLLNGQPGLLYHTIGVNGTRFDHYNKANLFWQQLPQLKADLYIISLGTNDAQAAVFSEASFIAEVQQFLNQLRKSSPNAAIIFTTAADSYKARKNNSVLKQLNQSLSNYCQKNQLPLCDIYRSTGGYGSAQQWFRKGLMSRDRVHFTAEGYRIQGNLLLSSIAHGYNDYLSRQ